MCCFYVKAPVPLTSLFSEHFLHPPSFLPTLHLLIFFFSWRRRYRQSSKVGERMSEGEWVCDQPNAEPTPCVPHRLSAHLFPLPVEVSDALQLHACCCHRLDSRLQRQQCTESSCILQTDTTAITPTLLTEKHLDDLNSARSGWSSNATTQLSFSIKKLHFTAKVATHATLCCAFFKKSLPFKSFLFERH